MKWQNRFTLALLSVFAGLAMAAYSSARQVNEDPAVVLERAIQMETVDGDLQAAIELYKQVVARNGGNRGLAAKALLRLGGCYEKSGQEEARKTYQQLVSEYPEQEPEVRQARQRLATLVKAQSSSLAARLIRSTEGRMDVSGEVSPDGRFLSYMDDTSNLAIRDLRTGESRRLTDEGDWKESNRFPGLSRWSPDGKRLAYAWVVMPYQRNLKTTVELRVTDVTSKDTRVLHKSEKWVMPVGWFPDSESILAAGGGIVRISVVDGAITTLKEFARGPDRVCLSPDGKYIAFNSQKNGDSGDNDVFVFPAEGGSETAVVTGPYNDMLLAWTPDGRSILFSSNRSGTYDAWLLRVENGKAAGAPEVLQQNLGMVQPIGFAPDGSFYFSREVFLHDILVADWDNDTAKPVSTPEKATEYFAGSTSWPTWSRDSKKLAYLVHRGALYRSAENQVRVRDLRTGDEFSVPKITGPVRSLDWSPDGSSLLMCGRRPLDRRVRVCEIVDVKSGDILQEAAAGRGNENPTKAVWAPDGRAVYYATWVTNKGRGRIVRRDLGTGEEKTLYSLDRFHNPIYPTVSPDGNYLAFVLASLLEEGKTLDNRVMLIPTSGGEARELTRMKNLPRGSITWSPDSRYVYFAQEGPNRVGRMYRVSIAGGTPEELDSEMKDLFESSMRPDGRQMAFTVFSRRGELWVMENLLPKSEAAR